MNKIKKYISFLLTLALCVGLIPAISGVGGLTDSANTVYAAGTGKSIQLVKNGSASNITGGQKSTVYFGHYLQSRSSNWTNEDKTYLQDPIKWRVLQNSGGKLFLLSDMLLDKIEYNKVLKEITWQKSTIRSWLNGYGSSENSDKQDFTTKNFISYALSVYERLVVPKTHLVNAKNPDYGTPGGNETDDQIFLLSIDDSKNSAYGFYPTTGDTDTRVALITEFAADSGQTQTPSEVKPGEASLWWLRSPGSSKTTAAEIGSKGTISSASVFSNLITVRPALNVDLNKVLFTSAAVGGKKTDVSKTLSEIDVYNGDEWKLTVCDSSRSFKITEKNATRIEDVPSSFTIHYSGAKAGSNEYISVLLTNQYGELKYYGRVAKVTSASGTATVDLPGLSDGKYTLKVFNEQCNDDYLTDYSSAFCDVELTVIGASEITCGEYTVRVGNGGEKAYCLFTPSVTGNYTFKSLDTGTKPKKKLSILDLNMVMLADVGPTDSTSGNFSYTRQLEKGKTYVIRLGYSDSSTTGEYDFSVWGPKPVITKQPQSFTAYVGDKVTFTVAANGTTKTYQWQYRNSSSGNWYPVTGETEDTLTVTASQIKNGYQYRCAVKNENNEAPTYSNAATLTVKLRDLITYGTYPQEEVKDAELITKLEAAEKTWKSYGYYYGTGKTDGTMQPGDFMQFADFFYNGQKYRALKFSDYRPKLTSWTKHYGNSNHAYNGYYEKKTYYFLYQPIKWRVLDPDSGLILCEDILDSQAYQNTIFEAADGEYYQAQGSTVYANNYAKSSIRAWLNKDFLDTAFTAEQQAGIRNDVAISTASPNGSYNSDPLSVKDKVFLLSYDELISEDYAFKDSDSVNIGGTDYSKSQGLGVHEDSDPRFDGKASWLLRTPQDNSKGVYCITYIGVNRASTSAYSTGTGIRPAIRLKDLTMDDTVSELLYSETGLIKDGFVTLAWTEKTYNGSVQKPSVTVKNNKGETLKENTDYTLGYSGGCKDVGTYTVTVTGKGDYSGTVSKSFKINAQALTDNRLTLGWTEKTYNGAAQKPGVTVKSAEGTTLKENTDYTVRYSDGCTAAGSYTVTVTGKGNFKNGGSKSFKITQQALADSRVTLAWTEKPYSGSAQKPGVTVKSAEGATLKENTDYTLSFTGDCKSLGSYTVTVTGKGSFKGSVSKKFTIKQQELTAGNVTLSWTSKAYNGEVQKPAVTVKSAEGTALKENTDYTVAFSGDCRDVGTFAVTVSGKGNYSGVATVLFSITNHDHKWDSGKITRAATCKDEGIKTYTCTVSGCGATRTETIPKTTDHKWDAGKVTKAATCKETGVKTYTCSVCKTTKTESIPKTTDHKWDAGKVTKAATATAEGVRTYTCSVCGATKTEAIPKTSSGSDDFLLGDVDGDGQVLSGDARYALRAAVGLDDTAEGLDFSKNTNRCFKAADITGDKIILSEDARLILRAAVNLCDLKDKSTW